MAATAQQPQIPLGVLPALGERLDMMIVQAAGRAAFSALALITGSNGNLSVLGDVPDPEGHTRLHRDGETLGSGALAVLADARDDPLAGKLPAAVDAPECAHTLLRDQPLVDRGFQVRRLRASFIACLQAGHGFSPSR